ncbi:hypothetical protein BDK51DRAFT_25803 [Blyttiomyces helicus]|uniref:Transmembrane protein 242 n=1 Tax=Blyttiomyces helicus TaxID=388810 RepID=A0A4P9WIH6_9FUNG|nr:hypothetical protein BDK51DRAFT_25803 [Blyttiomyces helicus]|eukprot:RKO90930.1 hypothetical protein BDK51DRAFT_25803 [Blyttiomyces helicus]
MSTPTDPTTQRTWSAWAATWVPSSSWFRPSNPTNPSLLPPAVKVAVVVPEPAPVVLLPDPAPVVVAALEPTPSSVVLAVERQIATEQDWTNAWYNKYIVGAASLTAFGSLIYTIRQRTTGKMKMPLEELMTNPAAAAANPKLAAYMFAGRAFGTATILVATGTMALTMGVASLMGVNNLREFSTKMRELTSSTRLRRTDPMLTGDQKEPFDNDVYELLKEVSADAAQDPVPETETQARLSGIVRKTLGDFAPRRA